MSTQKFGKVTMKQHWSDRTHGALIFYNDEPENVEVTVRVPAPDDSGGMTPDKFHKCVTIPPCQSSDIHLTLKLGDQCLVRVEKTVFEPTVVVLGEETL